MTTYRLTEFDFEHRVIDHDTIFYDWLRRAKEGKLEPNEDVYEEEIELNYKSVPISRYLELKSRIDFNKNDNVIISLANHEEWDLYLIGELSNIETLEIEGDLKSIYLNSIRCQKLIIKAKTSELKLEYFNGLCDIDIYSDSSINITLDSIELINPIIALEAPIINIINKERNIRVHYDYEIKPKFQFKVSEALNVEPYILNVFGIHDLESLANCLFTEEEMKLIDSLN